MEAYAVIETGGKQYRVQKGTVLDVELLGVEAGKEAVFSKVLAVNTGSELKVGAPVVQGASVKAVVEKDLRGPKVVAFKKKRRKGFHKKIGHRQNLSRVKISDISAG